MIHKAKDLSQDQKMVIESLPGRSVEGRLPKRVGSGHLQNQLSNRGAG